LNLFCENGTSAAIAQHFPGPEPFFQLFGQLPTLSFCFMSTPRKVKASDAASTKPPRVLTDEQKEKKRSNEKQRQRDQRVSENLRRDEIASLSAKNARLAKRLSDVMQPAPKIDDVECESPAPVPLPEPQGAVRSTGTESDDGDDGDDEINDGTYVAPSQKETDATNVLEKLQHARSSDKAMRRWTGLTVAVFEALVLAYTPFLHTTTKVSQPAVHTIGLPHF
jgi:hypothetical protein